MHSTLATKVEELMAAPWSPPYAATDGVVVHLIGWAGAQAKHLQKYETVWRTLPGAPTTVLELSHCTMGVTEAWSYAKFDDIASELLARLASAPAACKIILHVFSNGGGTLWAALARKMQSQGASVQLAALVFDSARAHHSPTRLPTLNLYSPDDAMMSSHAVEESAQAHSDLGHCDVTAKRCERSPHVCHLRITDPEGYSQACAEILSKV